MDGYISYLLDKYSVIGDEVIIDCRNEVTAEEVSSFLGIERKKTKITGKRQDIFKKVVPIEKYGEYHAYQMENLLPIIIKPEKEDEYFAAILDLEGSFKWNRKDDKMYPIAAFRKKAILEDLCIFLKKTYKDSINIQGKQLLFVLDRLKDSLIVRKKEAELMIDCLMEPDNPYYAEELENYTKNKKK